MSYDVGCEGVWGVLLDEANVGSMLYMQLQDVITNIDWDSWSGDENDALDTLLPQVKAVLLNKGVTCPDVAHLFYTGNGDDRPGNCDTPTESFVLGVGIYVPPWAWAGNVHESFKKVAGPHTWVWGG